MTGSVEQRLHALQRLNQRPIQFFQVGNALSGLVFDRQLSNAGS